MKTNNATRKKQSGSHVKKYLELKQNPHNANIEQDVRSQNYVSAEIKKIHESDIDKQDGIGYLRPRIKEGGHISFVATSDIHIKTAKAKIVKELIKYIQTTNTLMMEGGDLLQIDKDGYQDGTNESRINSNEEINLLKNILRPIAHKIIGAVGGNHDDPEFASRLKDTYIKVLKQMYDELGVYYSSNGIVIEWIVPVYSKNKVVGETSFVQVLLHDHGKGKSKKLDSAKTTLAQGMAVINKFNERMGTNLIPDIITGGHFHAAADLEEVFEADIVDKRGLTTGTYLHTIRVRSNNTLQNSNSSAFNRKFGDRQVATFTQTDVYFEANPSFNPNGTNMKPKFIPIVNEFPILTSKGELTTPAKEYNEKRRDYSQDYYNLYSKELKKSDVTEVLDIMDEAITELK